MLKSSYSKRAKPSPEGSVGITKSEFIESLRENPTQSEIELYGALVEAGIGFEFQPLVCGYVPDFMFKGKRIVELDGIFHKDKEVYDRNREEVLKRNGYKILRLPSQMVFTNIKGVIAQIKAFLR